MSKKFSAGHSVSGGAGAKLPASFEESEMRRSVALFAAVITVATGSAALVARTPAASAALEAAVAAPHRSDANRARDKYRNPAATLAFFGVKPTHNVVEIYPGGGWYTEILAPYLANGGKLTVAAPLGRATENIAKKLDGAPAIYGKVARANFPMADGATPVAPGTADVVLTFRNVHNWRFGGADKAQAAFDQMFAMLKAGGTLGVVEHRLPENMDAAREEQSGYMKRSSVVAFAKKAGFQLAAESQINANPRDTHDYPKGVWTLPPNYAEGEVNRARYAAIGESDRMTLKFVKPRR
jgi:predicted methyltransferase